MSSSARSSAAAPLRRVVRHRARHWRHLQHLTAQLARRRARPRTQSRYDRQLKDGRIFITQPALRYLPFQTTGTIYFHEDLSPPSELTRAFNASRKGASIQQEVKLLDSYVWSWGYRWERARTLEPVAGVLIGDPHTVSPLTSTLTRETP
jgi:hypothetical protein